MKHLVTLSRPALADISFEGIEEAASAIRMLISMLQEAHEVLGIPIPDKGA